MRRNQKFEAANLSLTSMIDVVFLLLVFFIVTLKQEDILSRIDVARPAPDPVRPVVETPVPLKISVYKRGWVVNGASVSRGDLDAKLARLGEMDNRIPVVITCMGDSPHAYLVQVLDICAKYGFENLSLFSS